jgi:rare lipoprotein A
VPEAHAGIFSFLKHHLLSGHSSTQQKPKVAYHHHFFHWHSHDRTSNSDSPSREFVADKRVPERVVSYRLMRPAPPETSVVGDQPVIDGAAATAAPLSTIQQPGESKDHAFSTRASWYGPGFDGKLTASGQRFDQYGLTAASRTLPLGSKLLVANPKTGKCCTVTINDRGPYVGGRDIDLSRGAAGKIGVTGVSPVVCVAYANKADDLSSPSVSSGQSSRSRKHGSRYRRSLTDGGVPEKVSGKVMHLIAGIL